MDLYTKVHVGISLVGIASGLVVLCGMLVAKRLDALTALFLVTTVLTSVTGFGFPFEGFKPSYVVAILSLIVLAVAIYARYPRKMQGRWRSTYVITALVALYFNVFVLVVQSFMKVPSLHDLAPTQSEPPFAITQLVVLVLFLALGFLAVKKFRSVPIRMA